MAWDIPGAVHLSTHDKYGRAYNIDLPYAGHDKGTIAVLEDNGAVEGPVTREAKKEVTANGS